MAEKLKVTKVKKTKDVPIAEIQTLYYDSKSHTQASKDLSNKYGLTSRAWRYKLRVLEEKGFLEPTLLPSFKQRDMPKIKEARKKYKVKAPEPPPKKVEKKPEKFVMVTVHFKIKYERIGGKGFHPFYLEGYYSKILPRNYDMTSIYVIMNYVQGRLDEFGTLVTYLEIMKDEFEEGLEVEELSETRKSDGDFKYNYGRRPVRMR